ncbi:unnamed protein product, partial [Prorocentrum cordatum]
TPSGQPRAPEAHGAIVALRADIAGLRAELSAAGERPLQAAAATVEAPRSEVEQLADEVDEASEGDRQKPRRPAACQVRGVAAAKPFASPTRVEALAEEAGCDGEGSPTAFLASQVTGGADECECCVLDPLLDFVAAGGGKREGQPFVRRRAQDGEDVKGELGATTSASQPALCALTGEPVIELAVEGVGGQTGVAPLAAGGFDVAALLGSELESIDGQQGVNHSGPLRGEGMRHCDGERKLEGLGVKKDFGYRQPLRGEGAGHGGGESKLEGIDAPKAVDHGKLDGSDARKGVGYAGPLRGEGVGRGECEVKQKGVDVMRGDGGHGGPLRGEGVGHSECEVKLEGPDVTKCKLVGIGKKGRPRKKGKAARATESAAGLSTADDAAKRARRALSLASAECSARADLAIEEIEVRAAAVELALAGGAWDEPPA